MIGYNSLFRIEAWQRKNKFDLLGVKNSGEEALALAKKNDNFFVRIVDCKQNRKQVWSNYTHEELAIAKKEALYEDINPVENEMPRIVLDTMPLVESWRKYD